MKLRPIGPNQTVLTTREGEILFSYDTPVAALHRGAFLRTSINHSRTTERHIKQWLEGATAEKVPQSSLDYLAEAANRKPEPEPDPFADPPVSEMLLDAIGRELQGKDTCDVRVGGTTYTIGKKEKS